MYVYIYNIYTIYIYILYIYIYYMLIRLLAPSRGLIWEGDVGHAGHGVADQEARLKATLRCDGNR